MSNWWADKLGTPAPQQPQQPQYQQPQYQQPPQPQYQGPGQVPYMPPQQQAPEPPTKAKNVQQTSRCPECGSGNYFLFEGAGSARCYDCGYPLVQAGSGLGSLLGARVVGEGTAIQPHSQNNWQPGTIIGNA